MVCEAVGIALQSTATEHGHPADCGGVGYPRQQHSSFDVYQVYTRHQGDSILYSYSGVSGFGRMYFKCNEISTRRHNAIFLCQPLAVQGFAVFHGFVWDSFSSSDFCHCAPKVSIDLSSTWSANDD